MIGLDFYKTITKHPKHFKHLAELYINAGYPVYIVTAVQAKNVMKVREEVKKSKVPHTHLEIVIFKELEEIPELKLNACQRLGIKYMYDDMEATCDLLAKHGVGVFQTK